MKNPFGVAESCISRPRFYETSMPLYLHHDIAAVLPSAHMVEEVEEVLVFRQRPSGVGD